MSNTVARVNVGGLPYRVEGAQKKTETDVTVTTNSETVTAANLGLNAINSARAQIVTGVATDTGVYATVTVTGQSSAVIALFDATGTAATTAANTVVRVFASGT